MRDKSLFGGAAAALMAALTLGGCSSVAGIPYPKLGDIVRAEGPSLSAEERAAMIENLKHDQESHEASATETIESR